MQENRERWMELADLAANRQDPQKLTAIVSEMCQLLLEKRERLDAVLFPKAVLNQKINYLRKSYQAESMGPAN